MFLNPLFLFLSAAAVFPVIFHLMRKFGKKEILFPASCLIPDSGIPMRKKFRLREIIQLILRILVILCIAAAFSRPVTNIKFPFTGTVTKSFLVADISESVVRSGIYDKRPEMEKLLKLVEAVCVTGMGRTQIIAGESFYDILSSPREKDGTADIPLSVLLCREKEAENLFLITDRQKVSWRKMDDLSFFFDCIAYPEKQYLFSVKFPRFPGWAVMGDTSFIFIQTNPGFNINFSYSGIDTFLDAEEGIFLPVHVASAAETLFFRSDAETLFIVIKPIEKVGIFSNNTEIYNRISSVFQRGSVQRVFSPEDAFLVFVDESQKIDFNFNFPENAKKCFFLDDGKKIGNYIESSYKVSVRDSGLSPAVIRQGFQGFLGTVVSSRVSLCTGDVNNLSAHILNRFDDGRPAVIKSSDALIFAFNPGNSTLYLRGDFPLIFLNPLFDDQGCFYLFPFVSQEERNSDFFPDSFSFANEVSLDEMIRRAEKQVLYDMSPFLTFILLLLLIAEGFYSFYLGKNR